MRVRVPKARVGALIGLNGRVKGFIERRLDVKMDVDSETGDVALVLSAGGSDPSMLFRARDIVKAIGRGFSPENAFKLLDEETYLWIIDLRDLFGKSQSDIQRVKGRIIGQGGKTRRIIEEVTGTRISVYGHTVAIIGELAHLEVAREAVEMLIRGRLHKSVYRFLEVRRRALRESEMDIWKRSPSELAKE